jgi:hypothetical protein
VKFWKKETKEQPVNLAEFLNTWTDDKPKVMWVEATAASKSIDDIQLELEYKGRKESVWATAIWGTVTNVEHDKNTPAQIFAAYPEIDTDPKHTNVRLAVTTAGGTGLVPPAAFIHNGILMEFTVSPADFSKHKEAVIVSFDISRRMHWDDKSYNAAGDLIEDPQATCLLQFPSMHPDATNDDNNNTDESTLLDKNAHMYSFDAPGVGVDPVVAGKVVHREKLFAKFEEFLRINMSNRAVTRPSGGENDEQTCIDYPTVDGSRASDRFLWSVHHTLLNDGTKMVRSTGDDEESEENFIRPGHWDAGG